MSDVLSRMDHIWHVWMNRQKAYSAQSDPFLRGIYEFKSLVQFLSYGAQQIQKAYEGKLPNVHRQCSRCEPEPITNNRLKCCLNGTDVTECEILVSLKAVAEEERKPITFPDGRQFERSISDEQIYELMARTCAWHIFATVIGATTGWHGIDTSEGYLNDESDRMFWKRVYESMAGDDPDDSENPA